MALKEQCSDLAAITISTRIPQFWTDMPRMWFSQFEAIIKPQHASENTKFDLVLSKLGKEELSQVTDIIDEPPEQQRYDVLKKRLLKVFQESAQAQFHKLVKEMDLGQQRPSQLLSKMRELAKNSGTDGETLKNLWLARLPGWVRAILASSGADTKLEELASLADKIMENLKNGEIAVVDTPSTVTTTTVDAVNLELVRQVREMSLELKNLRGDVSSIRNQQMQRRFNWRDRSRSRPRFAYQRRSGPSPHRRGADWLCRYHYKFREQAKRCEAPCNWKPKSEN